MKEEELGNLHGIKMASSCPTISHLLFVDDVMIFSSANAREAQVDLNCLTTYSNWSGQRINIAQSAVFYSKNCGTASRNSINGILNLLQIPARAKHLRIPLFFFFAQKEVSILY